MLQLQHFLYICDLKGKTMPEVLTIEEIKAQYPDQWVLLSLPNSDALERPDKGSVLLHGKDYLELCYKASEIAKNVVTTILFTGEPTKNRKWLKSSILREKLAMI
jgi:hypothetical protein